jgi:hypothetical protein
MGYMYLAVAAHLECRKACGGDVEPTSLIRGETRHVLAEYRLRHALSYQRTLGFSTGWISQQKCHERGYFALTFESHVYRLQGMSPVFS